MNNLKKYIILNNMKVSEIIKENVVSLGAKEYYDIVNNLWSKEYSDIFKKAILNEIYI